MPFFIYSFVVCGTFQIIHINERLTVRRAQPNCDINYSHQMSHNMRAGPTRRPAVRAAYLQTAGRLLIVNRLPADCARDLLWAPSIRLVLCSRSHFPENVRRR